MTSVTDSPWYYQKEKLYSTPSQLSGLSFATENENRHKRMAFIMIISMHLNLLQLTMATADYEYYDVEAICGCLATETEESTRELQGYCYRLCTNCGQVGQDHRIRETQKKDESAMAM
ncbi:MAG: hypothetical protein J3R72DRAFT_422814 [Linnemannia gamsii]|nr:MAG: hypothetical protein J3R72DRAFT_422814 [Linnemannia gamsii]